MKEEVKSETPEITITDRTLINLYSLHIGCQVYTPKVVTIVDSAGRKYNSNIGKLSGASQADNGTLYVEYAENISETFKNFNNSLQCKLVLRELFEVTDNELIEMGNLLMEAEWKPAPPMLLPRDVRGISCKSEDDDYHLNIHKDFSIETNVYKVNQHYITQYMLKMGFALPMVELQGYTLIQTGFAIKI
jgi:hypothetical protein